MPGFQSIKITEQSKMKRIISIIALWLIALSALFFGRLAHADTFNPAIDELRAWNCQLNEDTDCILRLKSKASQPGETKLFRARIEQDEHNKFFLRDPKTEQRYFFSYDLAKKSPKVVQDIITSCQFRSKDNYCIISANIDFDTIKTIENWSLHHYQIAK